SVSCSKPLHPITSRSSGSVRWRNASFRRCWTQSRGPSSSADGSRTRRAVVAPPSTTVRSSPSHSFRSGIAEGFGLRRAGTWTPPETHSWNLYAGQSLDLTAAPGSPVWATGAVTTTPMHVGDICNLGIFCVDPNSNRNLLDFNSETVDPTTGFAHI